MPRNKAYNKEEVLEKAMYTFWQNGYERTSVRQLEEDMGINQFSIYNSFGNKHDLFIEVLKIYRSYVARNFLVTLKYSKGKLVDIRKFLADYAQAVREGENAKGCLMMNTSLEVGQKDEMVFQELVIYFDYIRGMFSRTLEKSKRRGEVSKDFDVAKHAHFLLGALQGLSVYAKFQQPEEIEDFIDQVINHLR